MEENGNDRKRNIHKRVSEWNFRTFLLLGVILVLFTKIVFDFVGFRAFISQAFGFFLSVLSYLMVGFVLAYVLNAYMMWLERIPLKKMKSGKGKRYLSIVIAYLTLLAFVVFLIFAIVPMLVESVGDLARICPGLFDKVYNFYLDVVERGRFNLPSMVQESIENGISGMRETLISYLSVDRLTSILTHVLTATGSGVFNLVMGVLVSVYMLLEKDAALLAGKRILHGLFKPERAERIMGNGRKVDLIFKQYFAGKLIQAIVILVLSYIVLLIGNVEYAILFAVILGFTNMIPYIGPWIGAIPTVLVSLVQDPWMGVRALICVLIIQMLDNWFITPNVVGGKMGVSPLLVLTGLCVGGTLFGFIGLLLGDVLAAIVKVLFYDSFVANRLKVQVAEGELDESYLSASEQDTKKKGWLSGIFPRIRKWLKTPKK